ncbi:uncharacterized protein LOC142085871 isoform X1 [Calonectris borealis]|uniref:uncharacterized protein LOC142085871 isoform X1 n=1 Tax=Calonectris borealis TaxID=1323832 RepID=UPI003F4C930A
MCSGGTLSILRSDSYADLSQYRDQHFRGTRYDQERLLRKSCTLYVGNLSFYTTEEQIHELFGKSGDIKKVIMGLDKVKKTACGFCFVEYYARGDAENAMRYINGTRLDDRIIRTDWDAGFKEGRQYGRGRSGGQEHLRLHFQRVPLIGNRTAWNSFSRESLCRMESLGKNVPGLQLWTNLKVINYSQTQSCPERRENISYNAVCLKYQSFKVLRIVMDSQTVEFDGQHWREHIFTGYLQKDVSISPVEGQSVLYLAKASEHTDGFTVTAFCVEGQGAFPCTHGTITKLIIFLFLSVMAGTYSVQEESFITAV